MRPRIALITTRSLCASAKLQMPVPNRNKIPIIKFQRLLPTGLEFRIAVYLECEVRDFSAGIRGALSSPSFGFPSASTLLPV
jgi:hypothetical protein